MARLLFVGGHDKSFYSSLSHAIRQASPDVVAIWTESFLQGRAILRAHPDFVMTILELTLPDGSGLVSLFQLRSEFPTMPILVTADSCDLKTACRVIDAGAAGYISRLVPLDIVARNIQIAMAENFCVPLLLISRSEQKDPRARLSSDQLCILDGLKKGLRSQEIALKLGITEERLKGCISILYRELEITNHTQVLLLQLEEIAQG